jgi:16S rRNA processing protein RimM
MHPDQEFVTIAKVIKTQGRIGEVAAALLTDFPERFETRRRLFALSEPRAGKTQQVKRRELQLEDHWFHKGQVVLKFKGVDSISQAEELIGCEIQLPLEERAALESDEIYISDLTGCTVFDSGREIGKISDVQFGSGEAPLLVIRGTVIQKTREFMVPFAAEYVVKLDAAGRRLEMKLPEGMLDLDAPLSREEKERQKQQD